MCGINGILHLQSQRKVDENLLLKMRDSLEHRGPDDAGFFLENNIGFGQRRLSIIDVSPAGHQPFYSDDGRYVMVFNGEIYNYKDFYSELKVNGFNIKTGSDSEVLLMLFQIYGLHMLYRLNGMFAFVIWDKAEKKLTAVRDRMGVKPLYYSFHKETFFFASEQKALFTAGIPLNIAQNSLEEYIFNRFVAGENTLYQNVKKILPGHYLVIEHSGKITFDKWWNLKSEIQNHARIENPNEWFRNTFDESVKLRMVSDVPVGVLLSGGLDSSSILASVKHQKFLNIETFNIGFKEKAHDESHLAKMLTEHYQYNFNSIQLDNQALFDKLLRATYMQDEPLMHLNEPHLLAVSELANSKVKVLLSGEGADELMGGYVRYKALKNSSLLHTIGVLGGIVNFSKKPRFDKLIRYSKIKNPEDLVIYNSSNFYPSDISEVFGIDKQPENAYRKQIYQEAKSLYPNSLQRQALYFDQHTYMCSLLDRNDRCTMGASIECREPFLDQRIIAGLGTLDDDWLFKGKKGKFILKNAVKERLPSEILNFKKVGLSSPWEKYLTKNQAFVEEFEAFRKSEIFGMPYFENIDADKLVNNIQKGDMTLLPHTLPLFMMHIWKKNYVDQFKTVKELV